MKAYYLQTNIFCIALLLVVYRRLINKRETISAQRLTFKYLMLSALAMCISDIFAWLCTGNMSTGMVFMLELFNILYDISIVVCCFSWMMYVNFRVNGLEYNHKREMLIGAIPLLIITLLICTNPFTGLMFTIDECNNYERGPGLWMHWVVSWGYLVAAELKVVLKLTKTKSRYACEKLMPLLYFIAAPVVAAVVQMIFYGVTVMQCGITLSIVIIAMSTLQDKIYSDPLTETNNRNAFDNYISERTNHTSARFTLLMCDVDRFKTINDTLGHVVGDIVLKRMALILKNVCGESSSRLFLCRYGGDEFIICSTDADDAEIERIKTSIAEKLKVLNKDYPLKIDLSLSIGSAQGVCSNSRDIETLIHQADEQMYSEKRAKAAESR